MQEDLHHLCVRCGAKHMEANPLKCEALYCYPCRMRRPLTLPDLTLDGTPLPVVGDSKLLGVHISSDLKWELHIKKIIAQANKCIFILIMAKKFRFSIPTLITLYQW